MAENIDIPVDADKMSFVEDIISFIWPKNYKVEFQKFSIGSYRKSVYSAFNKTMQNAVTFLKQNDEFHHVICESIQNFEHLNRETCMNLIKVLYQNYFPAGYNPNNFFQYCIHLGFVAFYSYSIGVRDAPDIASLSIYSVLKDQDMAAGGWDTLNRIAKRYAPMEQHCINLELPKSLTTDEEMPENSVYQNTAENEDVTNEFEGSYHLSGVKQDKQATNEENAEKPQKRPMMEKEPTSMPKKRSKYYPEKRF